MSLLQALRRMWDSSEGIDVDEWEHGFCRDIVERDVDDEDLSPRQLEKVEAIIEKNRNHRRRWV